MPNNVNSSQYNKNYFDNYNTYYNPTRFILKSLRKHFYYLKEKTSITCFGFDSGLNLQRLNKKFDKVFGYDINKAVIEDAEKYGFKSQVKLQDITEKRFDVIFKSDIVICVYVIEHLTDKQIELLIENMVRHSQVNIFRVTDKEDVNYTKDPTHINPKTLKEWGFFLKKIYQRYNYVKRPDEKVFCFYSRAFELIRKELEKKIQKEINNLWEKYLD